MSGRIVTGNHVLMKSINKNIILRIIMENEPISRSKIAEKINLALPTVMRIVDELINDNLLIETGKGQSSGGRKPILLKVNPNAIYFLGVDIARKLTVILTDLKGNEIDIWKETTDVFHGPEAIMDQIVKGINFLVESHSIPSEQIGGVGIGTPGSKFKYGSSIGSSVFHGWEGLDVKEWVKGKLDFPVVVDNVAKVGTIGEMWFGKGIGVRNFIYIFADYGIGSGIVINGDIYRGKDNSTGEFGHTIIESGGKQCYCGNKGCLEMYTSIPSILEELSQGLRSDGDSTHWDFAEETGEKLNFRLMLDAVAKGDKTASKVLKSAGEILGIGLSNLINLFNPDMVILGGELSVCCPMFVESAREAAYSRIFSKSAVNTPVIITGLQENAGSLGAAALVMNKLFKKPKL